MTPEEIADMDEYIKGCCPHVVNPPEDCIFCDPRPHMMLQCPKCCEHGACTWHLIEGIDATCRKCGEKSRPAAPGPGDIGIGS